MARVLIRNKRFEVYTRHEADELGMDYVKDWLKVKTGEWFLTTDGKVLECVARNERREYKQDYLRADGTTGTGIHKPWFEIVTGYGPTPSYKGQILAEKQKSAYWDKQRKDPLIRNVKATDMQRAFVDYLFMYGELDENGLWSPASIVKCYQSIYSDNNPKMSLERGLHILKKKRVKEYILNNMKKELDDVGLNDEFIAQKYKTIIDNSDSEKIVIEVLKEASKLRGHHDKEIERTDSSVILISSDDKILLAEQRKKLSTQDMDQILSGINIKTIDTVKEVEIAEEVELGESEDEESED